MGCEGSSVTPTAETATTASHAQKSRFRVGHYLKGTPIEKIAPQATYW